MKRELFKPKWNEPCLCGSGKKYRDCCWQRRPGFDIGKQYSQAVKEKNLERALLMCRADIVQYTIWHKTNTEPVLFRGGPALKLLRIDVNALADYVDRLFWLYNRLERTAEWFDVLERLRENIRHPTWQRKIAYFRAIACRGPQGDLQKAQQELKKAGAVTADEDDVALLQLYIDLESDNEPFAQRIALLDRILAISDERSDQLQYRGAKAVQYFLIKDRATAERELAQAIDAAKATIDDDPLSEYERLLTGRLLQMLASLRGDPQLFREAIGHFHALLLEDNWTKRGRAGLHREIGDSYKYAADWSAAELAYREALVTDENQLDRIHLAECLLNLKRVDEAEAEISRIDRTKLGRHEFEDFIFTFSAIAIWSEKEVLLRDSKELLTTTKIAEPYFNERRLNLLLAVGETLSNGTASQKAKTDSTPPGGIASTVSSFVLLQPNIMGLGINFNAIIDYMLRRKPKDS